MDLVHEERFLLTLVGGGAFGAALAAVPRVATVLETNTQIEAVGWTLAACWIVALLGTAMAGMAARYRLQVDTAAGLRAGALLLVVHALVVIAAMQLRSAVGAMALCVVAAMSLLSGALLVVPVAVDAVPRPLRSWARVAVGVVAVGGMLAAGWLMAVLADAHGDERAVVIVLGLTSLLGALAIATAGRFIRDDGPLAREASADKPDRGSASVDPVVDVRGLDVSYGSVQVLFGVDLAIAEGETVALLGTNGAGKTTLLRAILGLERPDRGSVRLRGRDITHARPERRFADGLVAVRGDEGVFPGLSVAENLQMSFTATDTAAADRRRRIEEVLDVFPGLRERLQLRAGQLSGGQRQQLALARALVLEPDVLVIDELSLGLAPIVVQSLIGVVERLREAAQSMLIVEQSMNIALSLCDRVVYVEKGRVVFVGTPDELRARGDLGDTVFFGAGRDPQHGVNV